MEELQKASAFLENAEFSGLLHFYIPLGDMSQTAGSAGI